MPHFSGVEQQYIQRAFDENMIAAHGSNINDFENYLCRYLNVKSCAALSSGTAAIHLALIILGIKEDDEVICSSFTFSATVNPVIYLKAKPIFVDSENETWNMCPVMLEKAIKDRISKGKTPKAIILVHLYGVPAKLDELLSVANKFDIPIIEDAAEAFGSSYKGKALGTFGELGIFSFNGNKIITTSGGGALVSDNKLYIEEAIFLATQAKDNAPHYQHSKIGYNYRMNNISAGIGIGQLGVIDQRVISRKNIFDLYAKKFNGIKGVFLLDELEGSFSNRWLTTILVDNFDIRENVRLALENMEIECKPLWKPLHLQPIFEKFPRYINGICESLFERGLCLPSSSNLFVNQVEIIVNVIKSKL